MYGLASIQKKKLLTCGCLGKSYFVLNQNFLIASEEEQKLRAKKKARFEGRKSFHSLKWEQITERTLGATRAIPATRNKTTLELVNIESRTETEDPPLEEENLLDNRSPRREVAPLAKGSRAHNRCH